jgi:carboxyl-terminal processing protease
MVSADSIHFPDSLKTYTMRLERPVYGGGGIMPDYFVPLDTTKYTDYHRSLASKGSLVQASLRYLDVKRDDILAEYKDIDDFDNNFKVDDEYMAILSDQANKDGVELKGGEEELERSLPELQKQLKLYIARDLWDFTDFMRIYNKNSDSFNKAYELVRSKKMDKVMLKE